jgi:SAM-dependent methyltransferase
LDAVRPARPEWEAVVPRLRGPLEPKDFLGKVVLDAGCGFGRHAYFAARYGADVVAMDAARDAVHAAQRNTQDVAGVHVVQGDVLRPPFRDGSFDIVYSFGVLHHVDSPESALEVLHGLLKSGGRLAFWVYGPRQGLMSRVGDWMGRQTSELEPDELHRLSVAVAYGLRAGSHVPYRILRRVPLANQVATHLRGTITTAGRSPSWRPTCTTGSRTPSGPRSRARSSKAGSRGTGTRRSPSDAA